MVVCGFMGIFSDFFNPMMYGKETLLRKCQKWDPIQTKFSVGSNGGGSDFSRLIELSFRHGLAVSTRLLALDWSDLEKLFPPKELNSWTF